MMKTISRTLAVAALVLMPTAAFAGGIDFGSTAFKILNSLSDTEFGVALGVYDLSLEMELFHAMETHT